MTTTEDRVHDALRTYRDGVETPDVSVIYARAQRQTAGRPEPRREPRRGRLAGRGALFTVVALGVGVPATAAGAVVAIHHFVADAGDPLEGANPDSKDPNAVASNLPSQVPGNTEKVAGGSVTLSVQSGTVGDHSCFALVHRSEAGEVIESQSACGGGGGVTYAQNSLGAVSLVYSDDHGAVRAVVQDPVRRYERRLHAGYAIGPMLTPGTITTTTYRADGRVIAVHHETLDANGNLDYRGSSASGS